MKKGCAKVNVIRWLSKTCYVWAREMRTGVKDEGVLIFFVLVPLV